MTFRSLATAYKRDLDRPAVTRPLAVCALLEARTTRDSDERTEVRTLETGSMRRACHSGSCKRDSGIERGGEGGELEPQPQEKEKKGEASGSVELHDDIYRPTSGSELGSKSSLLKVRSKALDHFFLEV